MGFSDNFKFAGSADSMFNQVGEAVPPIIAKQIAEFIKNKIQL
jgi:DNA (cytosine-5)-methyltransferase 1